MNKKYSSTPIFCRARLRPRGIVFFAPLALACAAGACSDAAEGDDLSSSSSNASVALGAIADTWVRSGSSINSNKGTEPTLQADGFDSGRAERRIFLKFRVAGSAGRKIESVKLRLRCSEGSISSGTVRSVSDTTWEEAKLTWSNQPSIGSVVAEEKVAVEGALVEFDVTSAVQGDGTYSFAITTATDDNVIYSSRENVGAAPELSVSYLGEASDAGPPADASPPGDAAATDARPPVTPPPPPPPPSSGDYLIMSRAALKALPMSGTAWATVQSSADESGVPNLCDQDNKTGVNALAAGLVYARTGNVAYRNKVIDLIKRAMPTQKDGCYNAVLSLGRQLGGYVMAADLADYRDASFTSWLSQIRTREIGGHGRWHQLRFTADDSATNWGMFAATSTLIADRFLGDTAQVARDWKIFTGYTDGSWPFKNGSSYQAAWNCGSYVPIENRNCKTPGGLEQNGALVEDASRNTYPSPHPTYTSESMQGLVVQAIVLRGAGYNAFGIGNSAVARVAAFQARFAIANPSSAGYYTMRVVNRVYGTSYPEKTPMGEGRIFGFADWLFQ
ncbi:MAG: DNRLRE domain-containing protein [Polyangiaceae bacterium]|nr:DNRLRE domain-containing protein [Polyangiaceae bacterium]